MRRGRRESDRIERVRRMALTRWAAARGTAGSAHACSEECTLKVERMLEIEASRAENETPASARQAAQNYVWAWPNVLSFVLLHPERCGRIMCGQSCGAPFVPHVPPRIL